jgi:CheY-like chemotaxis protein
VVTTDEDRERGLKAGALGVVQKPIQTREALDDVLRTISQYVERQTRRLVVVEPDAGRRAGLRKFLPADGVELTEAGSAREALALIEERPPDCVVLNPSLPDMAPQEFVDRLIETGEMAGTPVLVHGANGVTEEQTLALKRLAQAAVVREVQWPERLLDLAALFLHRRLEKLSEGQRQMIADLHDGDKSLAGRKVLIVDDDIRNIFALTSVIEQHHMTGLAAETGRDAITIIEQTPDLDVVLMDVMMPEMDGLDTMRTIRQNAHFRELPIIAVTAKAMKGDREKCIEAGAWDYLSKPVDPDELIAMLRAWLVR